MSPLALDPEATFEVVLATDQGKEDQPAFTFHHLSVRRWRQMASIYDGLEEASKGGFEKTLAAVVGELRAGLVGWRNLTDSAGAEIPFDLDLLEDVLTFREMLELMRGCIRGCTLGVDEKKGSGSQSTSSTASSAPAATPRNAEATSPAATGPAAGSSSSAPPAAAGEANANTAGVATGT